jgi:hypothetical protein
VYCAHRAFSVAFWVSVTISVLAGGCSNAKPEPPPVAPKIVETTATLSQQKMCAEQAKISFDEFDKAPTRGMKIATFSTSYTNHFDATMTTCYVEIFDSFSIDGGKTITTSKVVSDAFEGRTYASYMWTSDKVKKYWEVKPTLCTVTPRSQDEIICQSDTEFDSLVLKHFGTGE